MIPFYDALEIVKSIGFTNGTEHVDLLNSFQRVLAEDVFSDISMPPFNKSAMDGYAFRRSDLKNHLNVIEEIAAGTIPIKTIGENQCARIMTGAMVPLGADIVVMKEDIAEIAPDIVLCLKETPKSNICYTGEDVKVGDLVLAKGEVITPSHIAIMALSLIHI